MFHIYVYIVLILLYSSGVPARTTPANTSLMASTPECPYYAADCPVSDHCRYTIDANPYYYCCADGHCCMRTECISTDINCDDSVCEDYNICCRDMSHGRCCSNKEGQVRLVDGEDGNEGRVEIYHDYSWGTICDDGWDINDAKVVCRMLEFPGTISAPLYAHYGGGMGQIWLSEVNCDGTEAMLEDCSHNSWGVHHCEHNEDASAECQIPIRLVDGQMNKGRVEIFYAMYWGTICDSNWDINDAEVVCRMLGFPGVISAPTGAFYGEGSGPIWLNNVRCSGDESIIQDCLHDGLGTHSCTHNQDAAVECISTVRLVDGNRVNEGRVEIFHDGVWGTICDRGWDIQDAEVVCRMLGYPGATSAPTGAYNGEGVDQIWLSYMGCNGNEARLEDCYHSSWGLHSCDHGEDASAYCLPTARMIPDGDEVNNVGRVELYHAGQWGTVCSDSWDINDAEVVCRMIGFVGVTSALKNAFFGEGSGQIWLNNVNCMGNENAIENCNHDGWGSHKCVHSQDASAACFSFVRLEDGGRHNTGRVEIFHDGLWGTICGDNYWDIYDAKVVCNMLQFPGALSSPKGAYFGEGTGVVWMSYVRCSGNEATLEDCPHNGWGTSCDHAPDASVECDPSVRLVNGNNINNGRVEIFYNGEWGTICDNNWDMNDAQVVCKMLGFPGAKSESESASFGEGTGRIWLRNVACTGKESSIFECSHSEWGSCCCEHQNDVSVDCIPSVRLEGAVDGNDNEGRVEIFHSGIWGTICENEYYSSPKKWDTYDATVVCRMLGLHEGLPLHNAHFGKGSGQIWLSDVECTGKENTLKDCKHRGWGSASCDHNNDVSVQCLIYEELEPQFWILGVIWGIIFSIILIAICIYWDDLDEIHWGILAVTLEGLKFIPYRIPQLIIYTNTSAFSNTATVPRRPTPTPSVSSTIPPDTPPATYANDNVCCQPSNFPAEQNNVEPSAPSFMDKGPSTSYPAEIPDYSLCVICMDNEKNIFFKPCGHLCCCSQCGMNERDLDKCPICRVHIQNRQRVYT